MAKRRPPVRRELPADPGDAPLPPVPAWVKKRGEAFAREFVAHQEQRRAERIAALLRRVPPAVEAGGSAVVQEWAEELIAEPRLMLLLELRGDPRAPLPFTPDL